MNAPLESELPVDRWAVRLDEPPPPVACPPGTDDSPFLLFSLDVPTLEFRPRLSRFDEAA